MNHYHLFQEGSNAIPFHYDPRQGWLSPNECKETLNKLRTDLPVRLQNSTKTHDLIETTIHRLIIISAEASIEINETSETALDKVFAALLDALVRGIHEMTRQAMTEPFTDYDVLQMPSQQKPNTLAPYT